MFLWLLFYTVSSTKLDTPVSVSPIGSIRSELSSGFGGEYIFQTVSDDDLSSSLLLSNSKVTRFPGGTPADYWNFSTGWLKTPTGSGCGGCDSLPWRPTRNEDLSAYLSYTQQESVFVINQLTATLEDAIDSLYAYISAGINITRIELGNEMYDATRSDVVAAFPRPIDYALKASNWSIAIRKLFPNLKIAWIGCRDEWDTRSSLWNKEVMPLAIQNYPAGADAATIHLYPGISCLNNSTDPKSFNSFLAKAASEVIHYANYSNTTIPSSLRLYVTEWGTWGCNSLSSSWLLGLYHASFSILLPFALPRVDVLLPYCSVCGDSNMPSYTTQQYGPVVPPNTTVPNGTWQRTAPGHATSLVMKVMNAGNLQALEFSQNPLLDPSIPEALTLVGFRALKSKTIQAAIIANLGGNCINFDPLGLSFTCSSAIANIYSPKNISDTIKQGLQVSELLHQVNSLHGLLLLPPTSLTIVTC